MLRKSSFSRDLLNWLHTTERERYKFLLGVIFTVCFHLLVKEFNNIEMHVKIKLWAICSGCQALNLESRSSG